MFSEVQCGETFEEGDKKYDRPYFLCDSGIGLKLKGFIRPETEGEVGVDSGDKGGHRRWTWSKGNQRV